MRAFACPTCGQLVYFENSRCLRCGTALAFDPGSHELMALDDRHRRCANARLAECNWLVPSGGALLCLSCALTRTRPNDEDVEGMQAFAETEAAKRRLVFQLLELGLPVEPHDESTGEGLAFDLLSSRNGPVTTGHQDGVITVDLAESDDAHREQVRLELGEAYRTMLGHLRHEVGHYYWPILVERTVALNRFRALFDDERCDYGEALDEHYAKGPPAGWEQRYVSAYATMHPWEDWAETFAHVLHIRDALQTAAAFGIAVKGPEQAEVDHDLADSLRAEPGGDDESAPFRAALDEWLALTYALNAMNRSMGKGDLYPFVLAPAVVGKLSFTDLVLRRSGPL